MLYETFIIQPFIHQNRFTYKTALKQAIEFIQNAFAIHVQTSFQ